MIHGKRFIKIAIIAGLPLLSGSFYYCRLSYTVHYKNEVDARMNYIEHSADRPDILFMGSSRAAYLIDPRIIDSICHVSSYNLSKPGLNMPELRMMLRKCVDAGKKPAILVLNIDPTSFDTRKPVFDFPDFLAYAARDTIVYNAMASVQSEYKYRWSYPLYRFQRLAAINDGLKLRALFETGPQLVKLERMDIDENQPDNYKGFSPDYGTYQESLTRPFRMPCDEQGLSLLRDIVSFCKSHHIRLMLITAPMYKEYKKIFLNCDSILGVVSKIAREVNTPYYNLLNDPAYSNEENYYNFVHLNAFGARKYSVELGEMLQRFDSGNPVIRH